MSILKRLAVWRFFGGALLVLAVSACGGGGGGGGAPPSPPTPSIALPIQLEPSATLAVAPPAAEGADSGHSPEEFNIHHGLAQIKATAAYRRGYFGQGATIAVADDGFDLKHPDLARAKIVHPLDVTRNMTIISERREAHGTWVAALAAGARGNLGDGGTLTIQTFADRQNPVLEFTRNFHGVAPSASIMPLQLHGGGDPIEALKNAAKQQAHILNFSLRTIMQLEGTVEGRPNSFLTARMPPLLPLVPLSGIYGEFPRTTMALKDKDMVVVWAAGNEGWNSNNRQQEGACGKSASDKTIEGCPRDPMTNQHKYSLTKQEVAESLRITLLDGQRAPDSIYGKTLKELYEASILKTLDYNDPGGWAVAPYFEHELFGKWLVVGSVNPPENKLNSEIALSGFSNGCGAAKLWCITAPGEQLSVGFKSDKKTLRENFSGTSFSAPIASGALAVLKSRMPAMPMEAVLAVMLTSAEPKGARMTDNSRPDDLYGWGIVNLERAMTLQGQLTLMSPVAQSPASGALRLPSAFPGLKKQLQSLPAAVGGIGDAYFNVSLGALAETESPPPLPLGHAAAAMLHRPPIQKRVGGLFAARGADGKFQYAGAELDGGALGKWRWRRDWRNAPMAWPEWSAWRDGDDFAARPFFAGRRASVESVQMRGGGLRPFAARGGDNGGRWRQFGFRFRGGDERLSAAAAFSRLNESGRLLGADFGALGRPSARSWLGELEIGGALPGGFRGFASYQQAQARAEGAGMWAGFSDVRATGWAAGGEGRDMLLAGDRLRFAVRRAPATRGRAVLRHAAARGSFSKAFYFGEKQILEQKETAIKLRATSPLVLSLGYAFRPRLLSHGNQAVQMAAAVEHSPAADQTAFSTMLKMDF